jgi:hypothetical protein
MNARVPFLDVRGRRCIVVAVAAVVALALPAAAAAPAAQGLAAWTVAIPQPGALDITTPRSDGQMVVAAAGALSLLRGPALTPFARGDGGYATSAGEPYIAPSPTAAASAAPAARSPRTTSSPSSPATTRRSSASAPTAGRRRSQP